MAKKSTVKVRLVPEEKTDSKFYYYAKKPTSGLKAKDKLRLKKFNPATRKHDLFGSFERSVVETDPVNRFTSRFNFR